MSTDIQKGLHQNCTTILSNPMELTIEIKAINGAEGGT